MAVQDITFAKRDEYKRLGTAEGIVKLISNEKLDISRVLINGDWGEGKTEFCHKLLNLFGEQYHTIYIDAFASDSVDDPMLTLTAEIAKLLPEGKTRTRFINKVLPAVRVGAKTLGKASVAWLVKQNADDISDSFEKELQKGAQDLTDLAVESTLKQLVEVEKATKDLKSALDLLTTGEEGKPLIICIDEFDRCRPPYAISMLETVKHVFDSTGVNFIFSANKEILEQSIKHHYGVAEAGRYLDKFINFSVELPRAPKGHIGSNFEYNRSSVSHLRAELKGYGLEKFSSKFGMSLNKPLVPLSMLERLPTFTLRDAENLARNIAIYHQINDDYAANDVHDCVIIAGLIAYTFYKNEFENLEKGEYSQSSIMEHFISYPDENSLRGHGGLAPLIFCILIAGVTRPYLDTSAEPHFSESVLEEVAQRYNSSGYVISDLDDLKEAAQHFILTYKLMLNLS